MVKRRRLRRVKLWQLAAIAIVTFGTTGVTMGTWAWYDSNKDHNGVELRANAAQITATTKKTLDGYNDQIASAAALFSQPGLLDPSSFHAYVTSLDLYDRYKGIYGLGLISLVTAAQLPAFVAGWRASGDPGFAVSPPGIRPTYCLVKELDQQNLKTPISLVGYDMCTFKALLPVLESATSSGTGQSMAESTLVPGPAYVGNFLLVSPVYSGDPSTVAQRHAQSIGWVAALVNGGQMLEAAFGPAASHLGVELFAGSSTAAKQLVVSSPRGLKQGAAGSVTEHFTDSGTWTLRIHPLGGAPGPASPLQGPALVFVTAMLLNIGMAALVWDLGRGRLRARRSFMQSEERYRSLAASSPVGILELTQGGKALYFNRRLNEIAGVDDAFWHDHSWVDCVYPEDRADALKSARSAWTQMDDLGADFRLLRPSGELRNVRVLAAPVTGAADEASSFVVTVQDVTEEVAATEALAFQAMHDPLTGLPNRALFLDRLGVELAHSARSGTDLAVMFLDLDHFKVINDGMGHQAGDELLQAIAARLLGVVRAGESVARLGGDEFTFILHDVHGVDEAAAAA
ncbi:MAG TPA: diguanylate cyclase, partial [Acidimicrobiales bacterium]|nr:diguanylate cyclase [Acidimicrobiales bacterium]